MPSKFSPEDLKHPLYEYSQVITGHELIAIYEGLSRQYYDTPWWRFKLRWGLKISASAIYELIMWLNQGKPGMIDQGGIR